MTSFPETIAAIATPIGRGGIGIIRISGPKSLDIAKTVFRSRLNKRSFESHRLYLGCILDPLSGKTLDEVLLSYMKAPHSYTREDVVEINSHSGYLLLSKILQIILSQGARLAEPGEFTLRAFLNGRMDLTQAEAVIDLINSQSERGLHLASEQMRGSFKEAITGLRQRVIDLLALAEVSIDYPEEETTHLLEEIPAHLEESVLGPIGVLLEAHASKRMWIDGVNTVIIGRVNAGKSSLLNCLLAEEKAIVTPVPGTTRDVIESSVTVGGIPLRLTDTAGLREARDEVERAGIALAKKKLSQADLLLWVVDRSRPLEGEDLHLLSGLRGKETIVVLNKTDLPSAMSFGSVEAWGLPFVEISALSGEGIDRLRDIISATILKSDLEMTTSHMAPNLRHKEALLEALAFFESAVKGAREAAPMEIIALELKNGLEALGTIVGETADGDVLDSIFSRFCLGK